MISNQPTNPKFQTSLIALLDAAIAVDDAAKGNVQLFYPSINALKIVAQRGFNLDFLQLFETVHLDEPSACGRALRDRCRIVISDVTAEKSYSPFVSIALANGYRAVQSTPIIATNQSVVGMLSTHFANAHQLSAKAKKSLDQYAMEMGRAIEQVLPA